MTGDLTKPPPELLAGVEAVGKEYFSWQELSAMGIIAIMGIIAKMGIVGAQLAANETANRSKEWENGKTGI